MSGKEDTGVGPLLVNNVNTNTEDEEFLGNLVLLCLV